MLADLQANSTEVVVVTILVMTRKSTATSRHPTLASSLVAVRPALRHEVAEQLGAMLG